MKVKNLSNNSSDISVVVCTKNAAQTIIDCLKSIKLNKPKEIILVDADSVDNTQYLAAPFVDQIIMDPGLGLAVARNYGLNEVHGKYVCYVGPDNVLLENSLKLCVDYLNKSNHVGVSTQTVIKNANKTYFAQAMNLYRKSRFFSGTKKVIGTPFLFDTEILKKYGFDNKMSWSDDTDLCFRLTKDGYTVGTADIFVYEIGTANLSSIIRRWQGYGLSDSEYYNKYSTQWTLRRKILSFLHPLRSELIKPLISSRLKFIEKMQLFSFLLIITCIRYLSWLRHAIIK